MNVAICTPVYADPSFYYVRSLVPLLIHTQRQQPKLGLTLHFDQGSGVSVIRSFIAAKAIAEGADWLLWIDADQTFPEWAMLRLLSLGLPVVGCNIPTREHPPRNTAWREGESGLEPIWTTAEDAERQLVVPAARFGLGFCLMKADVLHAIGEPYFIEAPSPDNAFEKIMSEDINFCVRARTAGFPLHVDHLTSWHVGHVGRRVFTHEDVQAHRRQVSP